MKDKKAIGFVTVVYTGDVTTVIGQSKDGASIIVDPIYIRSNEDLSKFYESFEVVVVSSLVRVTSILGYVDGMENKTVDLSVEHMLKTDTYVPPGLITQMMKANGFVVKHHKRIQEDPYVALKSISRLPIGCVLVNRNKYSILKGVCSYSAYRSFIDISLFDSRTRMANARMMSAIDYLVSIGIVVSGKRSRTSIDSLLELVEASKNIVFKRRWRNKGRSLYCTDFVDNKIIETDPRLKALVDYDFKSAFYDRWITSSIKAGVYRYKDSNFMFDSKALNMMWQEVEPILIDRDFIVATKIKYSEFSEQVLLASDKCVFVDGINIYNSEIK